MRIIRILLFPITLIMGLVMIYRISRLGKIITDEELLDDLHTGRDD